MPPLRHLALAGTLLAAIVSTPAHAQITVFTSFDAWLASVTGVGVDDFNDLDIGQLEGYESPLARNAGSFSYIVSSEGTDGALYPSGSAADVWLSSFFLFDALTFDGFSPSVFGVAGDFFLTDEFGALGATGGLTVSVESDGFTLTETLTDASTMQFLGFTSTSAINSLRVAAVGDSEENFIFATVNDFRLGGAPVTSVPEPAGIALLLAGAGGLWRVARRRRILQH